MLDRGLTVDGAAQALGWNRARVTAWVKLLELPELAQQMIGDGRLALSSVEQLRAIGTVSPALLDALIDYLADGNEWAAERLAREPGWVLDSALRAGNSKVFAAHLGGRVDSHDIASLKLGKKAEAAYERAGELTHVLDRYAYVDVRFDESDVDQARAAGGPRRSRQLGAVGSELSRGAGSEDHAAHVAARVGDEPRWRRGFGGRQGSPRSPASRNDGTLRASRVGQDARRDRPRIR
jgi:hypothetical protein